MVYLSKGILPWKASKKEASVSHCGAIHKLTGTSAELWLSGRYEPCYTLSKEHTDELKQLVALGIAEISHDSDDIALYRLLTNCTICPVRVKKSFAILNKQERRIFRWIRYAGLRLTIAELVLLTERDIKPCSALLGKYNRQALTETIYTTATISDGILETKMESSPARDITVRAVLGVLHKKKVFLI